MSREQCLPSISFFLALFLHFLGALAAPIEPRATPNITTLFKGKKAGLIGAPGLSDASAFKQLSPYLSHYIDYTPNPADYNDVKGVGMIWGAAGSPCYNHDQLSDYVKMINGGTIPEIMLGFNEPDCPCTASAEMSVSSSITAWNKWLAPLGLKRNTILGSPSPCQQDGETFLAPFRQGLNADWDITTFHVYKDNVAEVKQVVEYFIEKYKRPVWITEIACVHDSGEWGGCEDQGTINSFVAGVVEYFESNENVVGYSLIWDGVKLGTAWPLSTGDGGLSTTGRAYLSAIS